MPRTGATGDRGPREPHVPDEPGGTVEGCEAVRQSLSARLDGERSPIRPALLRAHLEECTGCRTFARRALELKQGIPLHATRQAPTELVTALVGPTATTARAGARRRRPPGLRWALALPPALAIAVAAPIGASVHVRVVPTKDRTPCTAHLRPHHRADALS